MRIEFAFLADSAAILPNGTFCVLGGGIEAIEWVSVPFNRHMMSLVFKVWAKPEECNKNHIFGYNVKFGEKLVADGFQAVFKVEPKDQQKESSIVIRVAIKQLRFDEFGTYTFSIWIGGQTDRGKIVDGTVFHTLEIEAKQGNTYYIEQ